MQIIPQQNYLLIRVHDVPSDSAVALPEGIQREPYGEVIAHGSDCKFCMTGDFVLYMPSALLTGFDQFGDQRFIISEGSVFAKCDPATNQAGLSEPKILKNPAEGNGVL